MHLSLKPLAKAIFLEVLHADRRGRLSRRIRLPIYLDFWAALHPIRF